MRIEHGVISSSQLIFLTAGYIQGASLVIAFTHTITLQDNWIVVLSGFFAILPFIWAYVSLAQSFPGKNMVQIMEITFGTFLGKLLSVLYISFPFQVSAHNLRFISDFFLSYMYPETPLIVFMIMFVSVSAWAVRSGIEVIVRISVIMVSITLFVNILTFLLLLEEMEFTNFLPIFELSMKDFIQGTHIMAVIPYGELVIFLMVIPYMNKIKQAKSSVMWGLVIGATTLLILTVRDIAVLGILAPVLSSPSFEAVRMIDIAKIITRMEMLIAIVLLVTMFVKVSVLLYTSVLGFAQIFGLQSYKSLILPTGILSISFALLIHGSSMEQAYTAANIWPFYALLFLLIPLLTLCIAKIRGLPQKQGGKNG